MASIKMSKEEMEWRAESDARTLAEAKAIRKDKVRMKRAVGAAKKMVTEESGRLSALRSISKTTIKPRSRK